MMISTINFTTTISGAEPEQSKTRVDIYTDGSALGNPGPGGWGFVALLIDETQALFDQAERKAAAQAITTNNRAEMAAAINALRFIAEQQASGVWPSCPATIISDSQILVKGFTEWMPTWSARGWRKSNGKPIENRDLWERLQAATEGLNVGWYWIKGHSGNRWNDRAHALATEAAEEADRCGAALAI